MRQGADMLVASLDATKSSRNWDSRPGNFDRLNTRAIYASDNEHGIPRLPASLNEPALLVPYSDRHAIERAAGKDAAVHFFLDDYRFETCWSQPRRSLSRIARVGAALTPDFSLWLDMPLAMQVWQVYRSRWCGAWMHGHGITVTPTVSWSDERSYAFAFAGIANGSVVAVSTVGVLRDHGALWRFGEGYTAMLAAVQPAAVLCYGQWPDLLEQHVPVHTYPARWEK